jgi:hypothetical protein
LRKPTRTDRVSRCSNAVRNPTHLPLFPSLGRPSVASNQPRICTPFQVHIVYVRHKVRLLRPKVHSDGGLSGWLLRSMKCRMRDPLMRVLRSAPPTYGSGVSLSNEQLAEHTPSGPLIVIIPTSCSAPDLRPVSRRGTGGSYSHAALNYGCESSVPRR